MRTRYRSIGTGDVAPRGNIDPLINIAFMLSQPVDPSGVMADDRTFAGISEFQAILASNTPQLLKNLAEQLAVYSTGREIAFSDRDDIAAIVQRTQSHGGGVRTLVHELVRSHLFQTK